MKSKLIILSFIAVASFALADELWQKDVPGNKAKADKYWPLLVEAKAGKKDPIDSLLGKSVLDLAKIN